MGAIKSTQRPLEVSRIPFLKQAGWKERKVISYGMLGRRCVTEYHGFFRTAKKAYPGKAYQQSGWDWQFFVQNPPSGLERHENRFCFNPCGDGWYSVNFVFGECYPANALFTLQLKLSEMEELE